MTATSVLTLTVYLAIMVIVATAAVGIRSEWRELPPAPPPPVPVPVRAKGQSAARARHPFAHGPGRLARAAWRMSRVAARRTGAASVAAVRATPELPAHAARLGRHAAGRAEAGRVVFDRGASRRVYRLLHPGLRRLVPLRERIGSLVLAVLGPLRDLADRAAMAGRNAGTGTDVDTWQLRVATLRRRAAQWRVPRPRRAGDLGPADLGPADPDPVDLAPADLDAGEPAAADLDAGDPEAVDARSVGSEAGGPVLGDDLGPDDDRVLGDWSRPDTRSVPVAATAPTAVTSTAPARTSPASASPASASPASASPASASPAPGAPASGAPAVVQREAPAEPRPAPSQAALSAARLALAGIHRDHAARHQAAARQAARHHGSPEAAAPDADLDRPGEQDRVIDLTAVEAEVEAR